MEPLVYSTLLKDMLVHNALIYALQMPHLWLANSAVQQSLIDDKLKTVHCVPCWHMPKVPKRNSNAEQTKC